MKPIRNTRLSHIRTGFRPLTRKLLVSACLAVALLAALPRPAFAIFGLGDIVYDPTNWAEAVAQFEQDVQIVQQTLQTYNLLQSELRMISQRPWQTIATTLAPVAMDDLGFGPSPIGAAVNGLTNPHFAWTSSMMRMRSISPAYTPALANTSVSANTAGIQMTDGFSTDALSTVGAFRQAQPALNSAIASLNQSVESTDPADNTPVAQQNLTNGVLLQLLKLQQSVASLHAVIAEQLTAQGSWQRNAAAEATNMQIQAVDSRTAAPADYTNASATLMNYLIH